MMIFRIWLNILCQNLLKIIISICKVPKTPFRNINQFKKSLIFLCFSTEFSLILSVSTFFLGLSVKILIKSDTAFFALLANDLLIGDTSGELSLGLYLLLLLKLKSNWIVFFVMVACFFISTSTPEVSVSKLIFLFTFSGDTFTSWFIKVFSNLSTTSADGLFSIFLCKVMVRKFNYCMGSWEWNLSLRLNSAFLFKVINYFKHPLKWNNGSCKNLNLWNNLQ